MQWCQCFGEEAEAERTLREDRARMALASRSSSRPPGDATLVRKQSQPQLRKGTDLEETKHVRWQELESFRNRNEELRRQVEMRRRTLLERADALHYRS
jgi:hypothetical protein